MIQLNKPKTIDTTCKTHSYPTSLFCFDCSNSSTSLIGSIDAKRTEVISIYMNDLVILQIILKFLAPGVNIVHNPN